MPAAPFPQVGDAARPRLAHLTLEAVSKLPGVVGTDVGPHGMCVTDDPEAGVLRGVSVVAQRDGRYSVDLCLVAELVPLPALGDRIRSAVQERARREGMEEQLGTVTVRFAGVVSPEEVATPVVNDNEDGPAAAGGPVAGGPVPPPTGAATRPAQPPVSDSPIADVTTPAATESTPSSVPSRAQPASAPEPAPVPLGTVTVQFSRPIGADELHELAEQARDEARTGRNPDEPLAEPAGPGVSPRADTPPDDVHGP